MTAGMPTSPPPSVPRGPLALLAALALLCALLLEGGCRQRGEAAGTVEPLDESPAAPMGEPPAIPLPPDRPGISLEREPTIGVLLSSGGSAEFTTLVPGSLVGHALAVGAHHATVDGGSVVVDGVPVGPAALAELEAVGAEAPRFVAQALTPLGQSQVLRLAGEPLLVVDGRQLELIERVPLETYLQGVVPSEMPASWPAAALEAQAIAARSYACAHVLARAGQPWQLHWHYSVDMAYAGAGAHASAASRAAVERTCGMVLSAQGVPLPALFCAASGGRTESVDHLLGAGAGGRLALGAYMPVREDPASDPGAIGLGKAATHAAWQAEVSLADIAAGLAQYAREHPGERLPHGAITRVRIAARWSDSGRVATVAVTSRGRVVDIPATTFRMAVGPGILRSTWWDSCVSIHGGRFIVVRGHGFGHGVGMSQVSAWELAREGYAAADILGRFYTACALVRLYGPEG
jgi:SpoIID/LytB domain protein